MRFRGERRLSARRNVSWPAHPDPTLAAAVSEPQIGELKRNDPGAGTYAVFDAQDNSFAKRLESPFVHRAIISAAWWHFHREGEKSGCRD
jgi:hypothetical protein